jgi:endonuclease YncB( thermonuclease family)
VDIRFIGGRRLSHELVRAGLARWDRKMAPEDAGLARMEAEARAARRGFWALDVPIVSRRHSGR